MDFYLLYNYSNMSDIMWETARKIAHQSSQRVEEWLKNNWVTFQNISKFRIQVKSGSPDLKVEKTEWVYRVTGTTNTTYTLYRRKWRNAKIPISILTL